MGKLTDLYGNSPTLNSQSDETNYINDIDGKTALKDPRVLNDLRDYYYELGYGVTGWSDDDLVDQYYSDKRWGVVNSFSAGRRALESYNADDTQKERMRRLDQLWTKLPGAGEEGGTGYWDAVVDYGAGALFDPLNYVPFVGAAAKVGQATRAGAKLTGWQAAKMGGKRGAAIEAGIGGTHAAVLDVAEQSRDQSLGYQDGFDPMRSAVNTGIGTVIGAGAGTVLGGVGGVYGRSQGTKQVNAARYLGLTDEEIGQLSPAEAKKLLKEAQPKGGGYLGEADSRKTPEFEDDVVDAVDEAEVVPELSEAEQLRNSQINDLKSAEIEYQDKLLKLRKTNEAGKNDEQIIQTRNVINKLGELSQIEQRIEAKKAEIDELFSNKGKDNAEAKKRLADFNELRSDFAFAVDQIGNEEAFDNAMAEILRTLAKESAPSASTTAPTAPSAAAGGTGSPSSGATTSSVEPPVTSSAAPELEVPTGGEATPVTPEVPSAPEVQTEVTIPYRNEAQKTQINSQILEPYGITEVELDGILKDPDNGVQTFGKGKKTKGLIINDTIKEIKAHLDGAKPEIDTTPPAPVNVTTELRGLALDAGVDPNKITPPARSKTGKITKGQIEKAAKEAKEVDPYASQVAKEVQEISDKLVNTKGDKVAVIRVLAQNSDYKSDVDDIVSLFELRESQSNLKSDIGQPLTQTEKKKIKTLTRNIMKNYGVPRETAELMAEGDILDQRKIDKTPVRGTGQAIEDASKFTTAGRAASTGKIQGILKAGTPISKGSDYTTTGGNRVNKSAFGFEEAVIKAKSGDGPDIVEYTTIGPEKIFTRRGYQDVPSGTTAYADGISGRAFDSQDFAIEFRDGGKPKRPVQAETPATPDETPDAPEVDLDELLVQYADDPEGLLNALNSRMRTTASPTPEMKPSLPPVTRGDKLVVARRVDDVDDIRIINPKQVAAGKDATAILPKTGVYADPSKWDIRYAPRELYTDRPSKLKELFDTLPPENTEGVAGARIEAGWVSGRSEPTPFEDANKITVPRDKLGPVFTVAHQKAFGAKYSIPDEVPLSLIYSTIRKFETRRWASDAARLDENIATLTELYKVFDEVAPQGIIESQAKRADSVEQIKTAFSKYSQEEIDDAVDFVQKLGGDQTLGPRFQSGSQDIYGASSKFGPDGQGINTDITLSGQSNPVKNRTSTMYHEVAHWAYDHILTAKDRLEFWDATRKYYKESGIRDNDKIKAGLSKYKGMEGDFSPEFPDGFTSNSMDSPQEFFANQFQLWATRKRHIGNDTFWQKISRYAQAVMQRYSKDAAIDPELEPLFAKILPDNERVKFKINDTKPPKTSIGEHITKRFTEQALIRSELEDAILRDSASGIVNSTRELVTYMLSVAPRYTKKKAAELSANGLPISKTFYPFNRMQRTIHDRIDDLSEILGGRDRNDFSSDEASAYFDDGLSSGVDEQEVADKIVDFFSKGYEGSYQPSRGISAGAAKRMANTSLAKTLDNMGLALEASYRRTEAAAMSGSKPTLELKTTRPKRSTTVKNAKAKKAREEVAIDNDAAQTAKTTPAKRSRVSDEAPDGIDSASLPSLKDMNTNDLRKLYAKHRSTDAGDQIATELLRKEKSKPYPEEGIEIPREIGVMGKSDLNNGYLEAIDANDSKKISYFTAELRRRDKNKGKKRGDPTKLMPRYLSSSKTIQKEVADSMGIASSDGIPPSAKASIRDMLSFVTHRDPEVQYTARTMTYRMLNLMNKTTKENLDETNILNASDLARMANVQSGDAGSSVFVDVRSPEFRKFRSDLRRMSIGLTKGESSPFDLMHEVGHMVVRSGSLETTERAAILEAFQKANSKTKDRITRLYSEKYKDRTDEGMEDLLAEEWFAETLTEYMAERVSKGDILRATSTGDFSDLRLMNAFERALDRSLEYTAYVVNGLIGRNDIKQQFRRLVLFGDMFEAPRKNPLSDVPRSGPAIHPSYAADAVSDYIMSSPRGKQDKIKHFVEDGLSYDAESGDLIPFYHGTPNGYAFNRADNPNVVLRPSQRGFYGPATYLTDNPQAAAQTYSKKPTPESIRQQIMDTDLGDELKEDLIYDSLDLHEARKAIGNARREMYIAQASDASDDIDILTEKLDELVDVEQSILDDLSKHGIKTDPLVVPTYVRVRNPINFQVNAKYDSVQDHALRSIVEYFNMSDSLTPKAIQKFESAFEGGPRNGRETYQSLVSLLKDSGRGHLPAQQELNGALDDLGYDGMLTTHYNTLDADSSLQRMANGETYEGTQIPHRGVLVFDSQNIKHIDAAEFDSSDARLFHRLDEGNGIPKGVTGDILLGMMDGNINKVSDVNVGALGDLLEASDVSSELTGAVMSMTRGRTPNAREVKTLNKWNPANYFMEQSNKHKAMGAHWFGDWYKDHFPDVHQTFAKKYFPLFHKMKAMPDAKGKVMTWWDGGFGTAGRTIFRRGEVSQPDSHNKIVSALRRGTSSRQYKSLTNQEKDLYRDIRNSLDNEWDSMTREGVMTGKRKHYLPQIWSKDKITSNRDAFLNGMAGFYKREGTRNASTTPTPVRTDAEANEFAEKMFFKLTSDESDGVFIPEKGGSRNAVSDHIDFSRVLDLENDRLGLEQLEPFLENNLESLLVKYLEGSSRRILQTKRFGENAHGFHDYVKVATMGKKGIAKLLSTNKIFRKDFSARDEATGFIEDIELVDTVAMPFEGGRDGAAVKFTDNLVDVMTRKGEAGARKMLMDIAPPDGSGGPSKTYVRRVDAIVNALKDFGGEPARMTKDNYYHLNDSMRIAQKLPMQGLGGANKQMNSASKVIRGINSIRLLTYTTLTSLGDPALTLIRSGDMKSWIRGMSKAAFADADYKQMIHDVGTAMENIVHERQIYMYGAANSKLTNAFFNATMLTPWTDMNRKAAGAVGYESFIAEQRRAVRHYKAGVPISNQSSKYKTAHRYLSRYGLQDFLPEGSRRRESLSNRTLMANDDAVRKGVIRFADESIFQPNPNDIPQWAQSPVGSIVMQLKSFPLMMTRLGKYTLDETIGNMDTGKLTLNPKNMNKNPWPLLYLATMGPLFGAGAMATKDILQARGGEDGKSQELRNRNLAKSLGYDEKIHGDVNDFAGWYLEGMMQMGGLGLLGDISHSVATQIDNGAYGNQRIMSTFLGPTYGLANDVINMGAGLADTSDSNSKERTAVRTAVSQVPVLGGNRYFKETITDALAGQSSTDAKKEWWQK